MFTFYAGASLNTLGCPDDRARVFKDHESLGSESHYLIRAMRRLIDARKPPGLVTPLRLMFDGQPFGDIGCLYVGRDKACFWPALPSDADTTKHIDHITLEFANGKTHATRYNEERTPRRFTPKGRPWRLHEFPDSPISHWFQYVMPWNTLFQQDQLLQRGIEGKSVAGGRHVNRAFLEYASGIQNPVLVPISISAIGIPNYVLCMMFYAGSCAPLQATIAPEMFTISGIDDSVKGWGSNESIVGFYPVAFSRGGHTFVLGITCPPGDLVDGPSFGFPVRSAEVAAVVDGSSKRNSRPV
jgi:hypothetical protein